MAAPKSTLPNISHVAFVRQACQSPNNPQMYCYSPRNSSAECRAIARVWPDYWARTLGRDCCTVCACPHPLSASCPPASPLLPRPGPQILTHDSKPLCSAGKATLGAAFTNSGSQSRDQPTATLCFDAVNLRVRATRRAKRWDSRQLSGTSHSDRCPEGRWR